jgi:hypothetical protein
MTKEKFVANVIHIEMQRHHMYITLDVIKVANAAAAY